MENVNAPLISVIMPVYNSGNYLSVAVESILKQDFNEIELILVDDGSTDGSSKKCDEWARKDNRIVVIHQHNQGICKARNNAISIARGEYIGFSDHDDEFRPGAFSTAYREAKKNNADVVKFQKIEYIIKNEKIIRSKTKKFSDAVLEKKRIIENVFNLKFNEVLTCIWDGIYKKSLLEKHPFDERFKMGGEDIALMYDLILDTEKLVLLDNVFYNHYIRKGYSTSTKKNSNIYDNKLLLEEKFRNLLNHFVVSIDKHQFNYSLYLLIYIYLPIINNLQKSNLTQKDRIEKVKNMLNNDFYYSNFFLQKSKDFANVNLKYGMSYFLLKYKLFNTLFFIFKIRAKNS